MASGLKGLLEWSKRQVVGYPGVEITNFTSSWRNGIAFCALIHRYRPDLIDFHTLKQDDILENNELAFRVAESELSIPALLDAEDMVRMRIPDKLSVATYVSQFHNHLCKLTPEGGPDVHSYSATHSKRPLSADENEDPELRRKPPQPKPEPAVRQSLGDLCSHCGKKVYLLERHMVGPKLYHRVCYRRLTPNSHGKSPLKNYENSVLGAQDRHSGVVNRSSDSGASGVINRSSDSGSSGVINRSSDSGASGVINRSSESGAGLPSSAVHNNSVKDGNRTEGKPDLKEVHDSTKPNVSAGLPSWFKVNKGAKSKTSTEDLPNNRLRLSDEHDPSRTAKLKENAVFNDLGVLSSMNNTSSGELETDSPDSLHKQPVFPKVPNVDKNSPKSVKKREKRFLDFRSMSNDSLLGKKNTNVLKKERSVPDPESGSSARSRASAHWSTTSLDNSMTSSRQSMASYQSTDSIKSPLNHENPSTNNLDSVQSFVPISALISTPAAYGEDATDDATAETFQDPNQNIGDNSTDKTTIKPPIPVQPNFETFDEVVDTPERKEKLTQARSNTYVPDQDDKLPDAKLPWMTKEETKEEEVVAMDTSGDANDSGITVDSMDTTPSVKADEKETTDDYPEELNPFADEEDEPEKQIPSAFVNSQSPFKSSTVRSIRTASSPSRRKRAAPTLPPPSVRHSSRTEPVTGTVRNVAGERTSLPAKMETLEPRESPSVQRSPSNISPAGSPRRDKRPAPKPPVATPRVSLLNKEKNVNLPVRNDITASTSVSDHGKENITIVSNDLSNHDATTSIKTMNDAVPKVLTTPSSTKTMNDAVPKVLTTPSSTKTMNDAVPKVLTTPSSTKTMNDAVPKVLTTPSSTKTMNDAVPKVLTTPSSTKTMNDAVPKVVTTPSSLPLHQGGSSTMKRLKVTQDFNFTRTSVDSERDDAGSETDELLDQIDLNADSPMTPDNPIDIVLSGKATRSLSKKPAPPKPVPPKRKINVCQKMPTFEIEKELTDIEKELTELEGRGRTMEDSIRLADEEASCEDEAEMVRWFELVNDKNALVRREQELTYILREQDLEEDHEDIEHELRQLMAIQESLKTSEDRSRESELLERLLQIVNERNIIVHNIDDDRIRYEEEDRVIAATLAESFSRQTLNSSPSGSSGSPSSSLRSKKQEKKDRKEREKKEKEEKEKREKEEKERKHKEEKEKKEREKEKKEKKKKAGIFSCVANRKTSSTFYPADKPTEKPTVEEPAEPISEPKEPQAHSARKHGTTFYRDTDDVTI